MSLIGAETFKWEDADKRENIMYRLPRNIKYNDNIVVREDEIAVFYRDGKVLDYIDRPDRYALTSLNAPIVGKLVKFLSGTQQQAEVIYLQKRAIDGKFGSKQPYQFRDKEFGMVNLRVFGEFRYKISAPENFVNQFVGTFNFATSADLLVGQSVQVRPLSVAAGTVATDRVRLRRSNFTASVFLKSDPNFVVNNLPGLFASAAPPMTQIQVNTSTQTIYQGVAGYTALIVGDAVSIRGLLFKNVTPGTPPPLVADTVRKR